MVISDNRRIAINSAVLYAKLILTTIIGLYTSRVILLALGANDYGLYNLVGGIVSMMNFLGVTMTSVTNRYVIVEMGKGETGDVRKVFNTALIIHVGLALFFILLGETLGSYYVQHVAKFEPGKVDDALFVLHMSMLACVFNILYIPYNGLIMAREKFVFTSLVETGRALLQLTLVVALTYYIGDKLRMLAVIMAIYSVILPVSMFIYCHIKDREIIRWQFNRAWNDYKEMFKFAFWLMFGALAMIGQTQGANMIVNIFYGTLVNAAYGIATQVNNYVMLFVRSFNQAAVPQIMKTQKSDKERSVNLVYMTTRYSFLILLAPAVILMMNLDYVLKIWLKEVPEYTSMFIIILLSTSLVRCLGSGFDTTIQATGRIRLNQIVYSFAYLLVLPLAYVLYKMGSPVHTINVLIFLVAVAVLIFQIFYLSKITDLTVRGYIKNTITPCLLVCISIIPLVVINAFIPTGFTGFALSVFGSTVWIATSIYLVGITKNERGKIKSGVQKLIAKIRK